MLSTPSTSLLTSFPTSSFFFAESGLNSLHTQQFSQQEDYSANKDPDFKTRNLSSPLEASFESPHAYTKQNVDTESNPHAGAKVSSTTLSPHASSLLCNMRNWKPCGLKHGAIRVNPPNDDTYASTTSKSRQEMKSPSSRGKTKKLNVASPTSSELLNLKRSRSGRLLLPPVNRWQHEVVYDRDGSIVKVADVNPPNDASDASATSKISQENQTEAMQEAQLNNNKSTKARNLKKVKIHSISEEMKSPSTRDQTKKLNVASPTSSELLNLKRSRSGRLLLPSVDRWQREVIYDWDGSIIKVADVNKLTSVTESEPKQSRRRKL